MNTPEKPRPAGTSTTSSEGMMGIGITIASLGLLGLLLGLAQHLRSLPKFAIIWYAVGVILVFLGGIAIVSARARNNRR